MGSDHPSPPHRHNTYPSSSSTLNDAHCHLRKKGNSFTSIGGRKSRDSLRRRRLDILQQGLFLIVVLICSLSLYYNYEYSTNISTTKLSHFVADLDLNDKSSSSYSTKLGNQRKLLDLKNGGIVLFFHIPKTGGTSMRYIAKKSSQVEYYGNKETSMADIKKQISEWTLDKNIIGNGNRIKFVEFHWALEPFVQFKSELQQWRQSAEENDIPFFTFMIMRNPMSTYISIYNFFCVFLHKAGRVDCPLPHTVEEMIKTSPDNPQARWMCHGTTLASNEKDREHTSQDVHQCTDNLIEIIRAQFDWVGQMEKFQETLTLFQSMGIQFQPAHKNKVKGIKKIQKDELNLVQLEQLKQRLTLDQKLLDLTNSTFTLSEYGINSV